MAALRDLLAVACISVPGTGSGAQEALQDASPRPGELGWQPPGVSAVVMPDTVVHQDASGGSLQVLLALAGAADGGFVAVWRDTRDGSLGLYFTRLDPSGAPREPERSICSPHTMRRTDASAALAPDGAGAIAWTSVLGRGAVPFVRAFDAEGVLLGGERTVSPIVDPAPGALPRGGRGDEDVSCREPALLARPDGSLAVAWTRARRIEILELSREGDPVGAPVDLDPAQPAARGPVRLALGSDGVLACAWQTDTGEARVSVKRERRVVTNGIGRGVPRAIAADPAGGWWLLRLEDQRARVDHLALDGRPDRAPLVPSDAVARHADLAVFAGGVALLEAPVGTGDAGPPARVWIHDPTGAVLGDGPLACAPDDARGRADWRLASSGTRLLVAWTDTRAGDSDVWMRVIDPFAPGPERLGAERRLNTDVASANQGQPAIASSGEHGAIAWVDERGSPPRVYLRRFGTSGLAEHERALPLAHGSDEPPPSGGSVHRPTVAVRAGGDALVAWRAVDAGRVSGIVAQIVAADGSARTGLLAIDGGDGVAVGDPAVSALAGARGFALAWPRAGRGGVRVRLVEPGGALGPVRDASRPLEDSPEALRTSDVDLVELDDGRALLAWTAQPAPRRSVLRGRFLSDALVPLGDEIVFEPTARGDDWDPALAPMRGGGFVMSWTSGSVDDPVRDVVVRAFDGRANPRAQVLPACHPANEQDNSAIARLADGSFAVVWEDDISYYDQVYVRRLSADGRALGPMRRVNALETSFLPDRVVPRVAAFEGGFAAVFCDRHRGRGFDVVSVRVGAGFDGPAGDSSVPR